MVKKSREKMDLDMPSSGHDDIVVEGQKDLTEYLQISLKQSFPSTPQDGVKNKTQRHSEGDHFAQDTASMALSYLYDCGIVYHLLCLLESKKYYTQRKLRIISFYFNPTHSASASSECPSD